MRSTVIPAQITTVEDRIAGNLNFTQILLLMIPVIWIAVVYSLLPPAMDMVWYKLLIMFVITLLCIVLALRIKGKLLLEWAVLVITFNLRPTYYVFDKNDSSQRSIDLPVSKKRPTFALKRVEKKKVMTVAPQIAVSDLLRVEQLLEGKSFSLRESKKGGFDVALEQIRA